MAVTGKVQENITIGGRTFNVSNSFTGTGHTRVVDESIAIAADNLVAWTLDLSQLKMLYIHSTQIVTLETNSSSAPDDTIILAAGQPLIWYTGYLYDNLITADVTQLFVTNASQAIATLNIECLFDATP